MNEILQKYILNNIDKKHILFINGQDISTGSDFDIYCVTDDTIKSKVRIFKHGEDWVEIFIDNWSDMTTKVTNYDEICVGFINDMNNVLDNGHLSTAKELIPKEFKLPRNRLNLAYYRIKVLYSKYYGVDSIEAQQYFKWLIMQQLFMLAFHYSGTWPASPKKWHEQFMHIKTGFVQNVLKAQSDERIFMEMCSTEESKFSGIDIAKESRDNQITFLG